MLDVILTRVGKAEAAVALITDAMWLDPHHPQRLALEYLQTRIAPRDVGGGRATPWRTGHRR